MSARPALSSRLSGMKFMQKHETPKPPRQSPQQLTEQEVNPFQEPALVPELATAATSPLSPDGNSTLETTKFPTGSIIPPSESKRPRYVQMSNAVSRDSHLLYTESFSHAISNQSQGLSEMQARDTAVEMRDEMVKLQRGRRSYGGFNPTVNKINGIMEQTQLDVSADLDTISNDEFVEKSLRLQSQRKKAEDRRDKRQDKVPHSQRKGQQQDGGNAPSQHKHTAQNQSADRKKAKKSGKRKRPSGH